MNMVIWECYYDFDTITRIPNVIYDADNSEVFDFTNAKEEKGGWCVERIRTDKTTPNDENVVKRILEVRLVRRFRKTNIIVFSLLTTEYRLQNF